MPQNLEQRASEDSSSGQKGGFYQFLYGFGNGYLRTSDPVGGVYSHYTDKFTWGGSAWKDGLNEDGTKPSKINNNSFGYRLGRFFGFLTGGVSQVLTHGILQGAFLFYDYFMYKKFKNEGRGRFR